MFELLGNELLVSTNTTCRVQVVFSASVRFGPYYQFSIYVRRIVSHNAKRDTRCKKVYYFLTLVLRKDRSGFFYRRPLYTLFAQYHYKTLDFPCKGHFWFPVLWWVCERVFDRQYYYMTFIDIYRHIPLVSDFVLLFKCHENSNLFHEKFLLKKRVFDFLLF